MDSGIPALEWQSIHVGSGTLGSPAPARCGLGFTYLDSAKKRMGISQRILAVIRPETAIQRLILYQSFQCGRPWSSKVSWSGR